jgi:hypothetical protein
VPVAGGAERIAKERHRRHSGYGQRLKTDLAGRDCMKLIRRDNVISTTS